MPLAPQLTPPPTKGHVSVARVPDAWYIACTSRELGRGPLARRLLGTPLVLFRDAAGKAGALLDRCPHRNVPLSLGRVDGDVLECAYHGWRFDTGGACRGVPGLLGEADARGRQAPAFAVREQAGFVWVYGRPDAEPRGEPYRFPTLGLQGYTHVRRAVDVSATLHATVENALDVPHTAFLHRGLFRGAGEAHEITAVVRRWHDRVEAEYLGEPRPEGLAARLLSPSGGTVAHFDRFLMPCIAQVEYRLGEENHFLITSVCTPVSDFHTRMFVLVGFRLRLPGWLVRPFLQPVAMRIFRQDAEVLRRQTERVQEFGGEDFRSTELDMLGSHVMRLLRDAERGEVAPLAEPVLEKRIVFRA